MENEILDLQQRVNDLTLELTFAQIRLNLTTDVLFMLLNSVKPEAYENICSNYVLQYKEQKESALNEIFDSLIPVVDQSELLRRKIKLIAEAERMKFYYTTLGSSSQNN